MAAPNPGPDYLPVPADRPSDALRYADESCTGELELVLSPSGRFRAQIRHYDQGQNQKNFTRATVRGPVGTIANVNVPDDRFWHLWVPHPNGHEYLLCGGWGCPTTVVDCTLGTGAAYHEKNGWFWLSAFHCPADPTLLAVEGMYPAHSHDIRLVDFSDPSLPFQDLGCLTTDEQGYRIRDFEMLNGWASATELEVVQSHPFRIADGKRLEEFTEGELAAYKFKGSDPSGARFSR